MAELCCPECGSQLLYKDGLRYLSDGSTVQRFLCRNCGYRFSEKSISDMPKNTSPTVGTVEKTDLPSANLAEGSILTCADSAQVDIKRNVDKSYQHLGRKSSKTSLNQASFSANAESQSSFVQFCTSGKGGKSFKNCSTIRVSDAHQEAILMEVSKLENEKREAGATQQTAQQDVKGKIIEFLWQLEKNGRNSITIENYRRFLYCLLKRGVNLFSPEEVKAFIAKTKWNVSTKISAVRRLNVWFRFNKIQWEAPKYTPEGSIPFIPTEQELDQLIAAVGKKTAAYLQLLKETGARPGEISKLTWMDIDFEKRTVRLKPEKGSLPRILPLSTKAIEMLKNLSKKNEKIFPPVPIMEPTFRVQRNKLARKLCNPRFQQITFKTFRHWKGTTEYHKTKDPIHVKQILGHKDLKSTQVYIHIENAIYGAAADEEYCIKVAKTKEEITELLEVGFEYVFTHEGLAYFRKRK